MIIVPGNVQHTESDDIDVDGGQSAIYDGYSSADAHSVQ